MRVSRTRGVPTWQVCSIVSAVSPDAAAVLDDMEMLRDGAMFAGRLGEPAAVAGSFLRSSRAVIGNRRLARN